VRLTDRISLGVLAEVFPRDVIEDVLTETGRREQRSRLLPAHVMVRFCQAMCLFFDDDYEEVMRKLVGALKSMSSWRDDWTVPSTSAITQARQRLGADPLRVLFEKTAVPVARRGTKGAWLGSRRLMAVDGFMVDLPDTGDNAREFGRMDNGRKASAFPQAQVVVLGECGSHAITGAVTGPCNAHERVLAGQLTSRLEQGMLVIADRNFYSFDLWQEFRQTGADLLWRVNANLELAVVRWLPDGSYLSVIYDSKLRKRRRGELLRAAKEDAAIDPAEAHVVRVVEYDIPDREGSAAGEIICVITSILDPVAATAEELAAAYHERWECENLIDEVKTHQRGPARVLRSKSAEMVRQEIWALLLTHYGIRHLMCNAADEIGEDPDRLSFMRSLRVIRRHVTGQADFSP
jgi:Insertion element 4 transposase N-terminal/Transposase DDE domain